MRERATFEHPSQLHLNILFLVGLPTYGRRRVAAPPCPAPLGRGECLPGNRSRGRAIARDPAVSRRFRGEARAPAGAATREPAPSERRPRRRSRCERRAGRRQLGQVAGAKGAIAPWVQGWPCVSRKVVVSGFMHRRRHGKRGAGQRSA